MEKRQQASSFDPELFEEIQQTISDQLGNSATPDLEDHIWGEDVKSEAEKNLVNAQYCYEFLNTPFYSLYAQSLLKMVDREHRAFEKAESDPGDKLRIRWRVAQEIVSEIIGHIESGSEMYLRSIREIESVNETHGLPQTAL